jgi:hypothetical protein
MWRLEQLRHENEIMKANDLLDAYKKEVVSEADAKKAAIAGEVEKDKSQLEQFSNPELEKAVNE